MQKVASHKLVIDNGVISDVAPIIRRPWYKWPTTLPFMVVYAIVFSLYFYPDIVWSSTNYLVYQTYIDFFHFAFIPLSLFIHVFLALFTVWSIKFKIKCLYTKIPISKLYSATHIFVLAKPHKGEHEIVPLIVNRDRNGRPKETCFLFQQRKWTFEVTNKKQFVKPVFPNKLPMSTYAKCDGLETIDQIKGGFNAFGKNTLPLEVPEFTELLVDHAFGPFFVFQMFCVLLWCLDEYWMYSIFTGFMMIMMECMVVFQRIRNMKTLRQMGQVPIIKVVVKRCGKFMQINSDELLPLDLMIVPTNALCPADCVLVEGTCVVNEAMLTGESTPQLKESIENKEEQLVMKRDSRHLLFGGTQILLSTGKSNTFEFEMKDSALAVVLKTGFETKQGKLLRTIIHSQSRVSENSSEAFGFISILLVFAIVATGYLLRRGLSDPTKDRWKLFLHCTQILTSVVPTELPMELSLAVNNSLMTFIKQRIFCTEPFRIPSAGKLDTCCFDKTGTLTTDEMLFSGIDLINGKGLISTKEEIPHYAERVLAGCHALVHLPDGETAGDAMEKAAVDALGYKIIRDDRVERDKTVLNIINRYPFDPIVRRMSIVITVNDEKLIVTKGSPEGIRQLCKYIPDGYDDCYERYAALGLRVIALAYKEVPHDHRSKYMMSNMTRKEVECDLHFAGMAVFNCPLKKDAEESIRNLIAGSHRCVVITGDNIQTALAVSRQVGIAAAHKHLIAALHKNDLDTPEILNCIKGKNDYFPAFVHDSAMGLTAEEKKPKRWGYKELVDKIYVQKPLHVVPVKKRAEKLARMYDLCVNADGMPSEVFQEIVKHSAHLVSVWARCNPSQKEDIISRLKAMGHIVLMAGDGTNDVGGLKQADVGVAVLNSKAVEVPVEDKKEAETQQQQNPTLPPIPPGFKLEPEPKPLSKTPTFKENWSFIMAQTKRQAQINALKKLDTQKKARQEKEIYEQANDPTAVLKATVSDIPETSFSSLMGSAFNQDFDDESTTMIKLGDASIAAPFTSKSKRLMSIVDIVRGGRATLVVTLQMYKILALNCLVTAYSMSVLHSDGVKMGDKQMMISGLILSVCFMCMSRCQPKEKLSSQRPITRVFHPYMICSIFGQFAIHLYSMIATVKMVTSIDTDAITNQKRFTDTDDFKPSLLNSLMFLIQTMISATTFAVNYRGEPFMQKISRNRPMFIALIMLIMLVFIFASETNLEMNEYFDIVKFPSDEFRGMFLKLLITDMVLSYGIEMFCLKTMTDS